MSYKVGAELSGGFVRLEPGTTKNSEGRAFPLIPELRALLERRQSITRRCERAQGRIIAHVFHRYGKPIKSLRRACHKTEAVYRRYAIVAESDLREAGAKLAAALGTAAATASLSDISGDYVAANGGLSRSVSDNLGDSRPARIR